MFFVFVFFYFFIGTFPNVHLYSRCTVGVHDHPIYIYKVCVPICTVRTITEVLALCVPHLSRHWSRSLTLHPPRSTLALAAAPRLRSHAALDWEGAHHRTTCYHPPIPWRHEVGHDPRVCVHPTVLPPKKISCHLIWLSSTSSVVNLK